MPPRSNIEKLPTELRQQINEKLQDPNLTRQEIVDFINSEAGEKVTSRTAINKYAQKMSKFTENSRQAREVAEVYLSKFGNDTRNQLGKIVNEQIKFLSFDLAMAIQELKEQDNIAPKEIADLISKISKGLRELEQADKLNAEREAAIRKEALTQAVEAVEKSAKSEGLTKATIEKIKKQILGL